VTKHPVRYPTSCSPQTWLTGTPLLLLRRMLGLEPVGEQLIVDPVLPESIGTPALSDILGRGQGGRLGAGAVRCSDRYS
jgi:glycogen debranching enzyme